VAGFGHRTSREGDPGPSLWSSDSDGADGLSSQVEASEVTISPSS
jgi:hypothetical protein